MRPEGRPPKLFGRQKPLHAALGGGTVADIVLWRRKEVSASILAAATAAWLLFEVAEYHFLTLLCHIAILGMLVYFLWTSASALFDLPPPKIPETILSERTTNQMILAVHRRLALLISRLHDIACGKDLKSLILAVASLWITSIIGSCVSSLTLLYIVVLCSITLPALYERYESEVDYLAAKGLQDLKKMLANIDSEVLSKIPRGTTAKKKST